MNTALKMHLSDRKSARERAYTPWRQQLLPKSKLQELSTLRPVRVYRDVLISWTIIASLWWFSIAYLPTLLWFITIPLIGATYYKLFIIGHDGFHYRLLPNKYWNDIFSTTFVHAPIFTVTRVNRANHLDHHHFLSSEYDPDRHKHCSYNKQSKSDFLLFLTTLQNLKLSLRNVFFPNSGKKHTAKPSVTYRREEIAIVLAVQILIMGGLTLWGGLLAYPLLWLAPVYLFTYAPDSIRSFAEHSHPQEDSLADDHRLISYHPSRIEGFFFAPLSMNLHAAHHLWPSIPYYNLSEADRILRKEVENRNIEQIEWRKSYLQYLLHYYTSLPLG